MPETPQEKRHVHPFGKAADAAAPAPVADVPYAELEVTTNFSFLTGASHPEEFVQAAAALGYRAVAVTDTHSLAGIVRAHVAAKQAGIPLVVGTRTIPADAEGLAVLLYPSTRPAYASLCRLLTTGKRRAEKGECRLTLADLDGLDAGMLAVVVPPERIDAACEERVRRLRGVFGEDRLSVAVSRRYRQDDPERIAGCVRLAARCGVPLVATNAAHYHVPERRMLHDVLACIRHGVPIQRAGFRLEPNAEKHLKPGEEMARIFREHPRAIARTVEIAERCKGFSLDQLRYEYPDEVVPPGRTAMEHLAALTWEGAARRFPKGTPPKVVVQIEHELRLIEDLQYASYFLTVEEIVAFANSRGILCQGRGAAANSAVCYCLGVTAVDPSRVDMLFERFISKERDEPPDIDIDFEHERREEVIQHLYAKYGRNRAALTAEVISYRGKSAIRDVGKAMGLSLDVVSMLAKDLDWWSDTPGDPARLRAMGLKPDDPHLSLVIRLARELTGFPRHLSQHVGGFVITRTPLSELVPVENAAMIDRTVIEWDKDDIEAMGMLKVDVLGLGMLSCIRKAFELVRTSDGEPLTLATVPPEDAATYDMICDADTVGVFQIESRAQMSMLPRLRPRCYYDLVIEVAIVRPGPIQGQMVHPYLNRRSGMEPVRFASPEIERVLARTMGVPLFQEQAMAMAVVAAGFTPGEADQLRRAIASWKRSGNAIKAFERKLIDGMMSRGHTAEFAGQVFTQISGFSGYGFPESHAASFALLVYVSSWLKRHKPAAFAAALINSQPMGFYQPAQIVRDAQTHGVTVRPADVNHSDWDCTLEQTPDGHAIRLGLRLVKGVPQADAEKIVAARRAGGAFPDVLRLWRRSGASVRAMNRLAEADAFGSMRLVRREALWAVQALKDDPLPLFAGCEPPAEVAPPLPVQTPYGLVSEDYRSVGFSLKAHPLSFVRDGLTARRVIRNADLADPARTPDDERVTVAGIVLVRQRPGTASGIVFFTIEDETGIANLIVRPRIYERFRRVARHSPVIAATGTVERAGKVVHVLVRSIREVKMAEGAAFEGSRDFR